MGHGAVTVMQVVRCAQVRYLYLNLKFRIRFTGIDLHCHDLEPLLINITFRFKHRYYPMKIDKTFRRFLARLFVLTLLYVSACIYTNTHWCQWCRRPISKDVLMKLGTLLSIRDISRKARGKKNFMNAAILSIMDLCNQVINPHEVYTSPRNNGLFSWLRRVIVIPRNNNSATWEISSPRMIYEASNGTLRTRVSHRLYLTAY